MVILFVIMGLSLLFMFLVLIAEIICFRRKEKTWQNCEKCMASVLCTRRTERPLTEEEVNEIRKILSETDEKDENGCI